MGDGAIIEFGSVVDAVACAVAVQEGATVHQQEVTPESRIVFRIGINVGDVVIEDGDLLGDGVNVAARLEALAEPGGICVSDARAETPRRQDRLRLRGCWRTGVEEHRAAGSGLALGEGPIRTASSAPLPLPDRPSIAVLPFDNLSGQPEETYFSDGITEDIITGLARFRSLFVIARNSSFAFRGKAVEMAEIGRRLGVSYLLEGSVRRSGPRLRITAQLIEAATGAHLWAERYDRSLDDIFAVQDEVAQTIVATLFGRIQAAKHQQSFRMPTVSLAAYDFLLRGCVHLRGYTHDDNERALRLFDKAVELDPRYAVAHAFSGMTSVMLDRQVNAGIVSGEVLDVALDKAQTAVRLDPQESRCHRALVIIHLYRREFDLAEHHAHQGLAINPNDADQMSAMGLVMTVRGRPEDALGWHEKAIRLNPFHPPYYDLGLGKALYLVRRYEEAIHAYTRIPGSNLSIRVQLAACYAYAEQMAEARAHVAQLLEEQPTLGADDYAQRDFAFERAEDREHFREGLIKAGLLA